MNSSISSSDVTASDARRALWWVALSALATLAAALAFILATDPYDRGHRNLIGDRGVPEFGQPLRNAGIARQPGFDAALIGNSTFQLVSPAELGGPTGARFVSLTMLGARPGEMLAMARWFRAHHRSGVKALVFGIDESWCQPEAPLLKGRPFPYWLYDTSSLTYAAGVLRLDSLRHGVVRIAMALGRMPRMRADGFEDYEPLLGWQREVAQRAVTGPREIHHYDPAKTTWPGLQALEQFLAELEPSTAVVLTVLPRYHTSIPAPGTNHAALEAACRTRLLEIPARRPRTGVVDLLRDDADARNIEHWWDYIHYRGSLARKIETAIADAFRKLGQTP